MRTSKSDIITEMNRLAREVEKIIYGYDIENFQLRNQVGNFEIQQSLPWREIERLKKELRNKDEAIEILRKELSNSQVPPGAWYYRDLEHHNKIEKLESENNRLKKLLHNFYFNSEHY